MPESRMGEIAVGKVMAVNISEKKGTQKKNIHSCVFIEDFGLEKDAHAGKWHRQVSLLSYEKIEEFKAKGAPIEDGAFGENLIVEGFDFKSLPVGSRFQCNDVILEMTQIGKECHKGCEIRKIMGDCIMPREGVFAKVLHGGVISQGDEMVLLQERGAYPWVKVTMATDTNFYGPGVADLMELLSKSRTMKEACQEMEMSYTKGWRIINKAEEKLGYKLIYRQHGGAAGGGSSLTDEGAKYLEKYRLLEAEVNAYTRKRYMEIF